ncbi:hypothetical protein VPNG_03252 [Cytospora leucostoma]|uniref:Uncharacterized protein n=1 Tax=Cytospora leucostoma TaxID=1230097 RepID=A0A423XEZ3_9PEZI|nr:hypothetical protein VPNG_03252 [Cytospora leucostoma]
MAGGINADGWNEYGRQITLFDADPREREIGTANRENTFELLSSLAVYPLTERLGMSFTDVQLLVAQARREAQDPALKAYFPV